MNRPGRVRLFCLPFAGGSCYSYRDLKACTADFIDVIFIELPGRGKRVIEALLTSMDNIVDDVFHQVEVGLHDPYAVYGHSMGACLGYLLVKRIIREKLPEPVHLFFSGSEAPSVEKKAEERDRHLLPKDDFIGLLRELGGCPRGVLEDDELMDFFEPIIRADLQANDTYEYRETRPFDIPLTLMRGSDEKMTDEEVLKWQQETVAQLEVRQFPGGHFFIFDHFPEIGRMISRTLEQTISHPAVE